jgi:hypothetical protein
LDLVQLRDDLLFVEELSKSAIVADLRQESPLELRPGTRIVDVDRFLNSLQADFLAVLQAPHGAKLPVIEATAQACHGLASALRDLLDARDSERSARETLAELEAQAA